MRWLPLVLLAVGCRVAPASDSAADAPDDEGWAFEHTTLDALAAPSARMTLATVPTDSIPHDTRARGPWGAAISADSFRALAAAVDTSVSGTTRLIGSVGDYHAGEVPAQDGERWQGLYTPASGAELRSFRLTVEPIRDVVLDDEGDPPTGERVRTPFSAVTAYDDYSVVEDDALFLVRRPGTPFPSRPATVLAGEWPITSGHLTLALAGRHYALSVIEGPEEVWSQKPVRPWRVLVLSRDGGAGQPIAHVGGDDGSPAILWAGDLDGDGHLDLVVDETTHYNASAPALFLSSEAGPGDLVQRTTRTVSVGC